MEVLTAAPVTMATFADELECCSPLRSIDFHLDKPTCIQGC